jgi:hypothetical protein
MRACILNTELLLFCMFWPITFSFRIRHYLWDTLSINVINIKILKVLLWYTCISVSRFGEVRRCAECSCWCCGICAIINIDTLLSSV